MTQNAKVTSNIASFTIGDAVQIINHTEQSYMGKYGTIRAAELAYNNTVYYHVDIDDTYTTCICTDDELMEG